MANKKTLTNWILANRSKLDVRVKDCAWIRHIYPGWYDLSVSISAYGQRFSGRGADQDSDTALSKAFCEAVERSVCYSHGISSLGVAGHVSADEAKENARIEYIERKTVFEQFTKGRKLEVVELDSALKEKYKNRGVGLSLYELASRDAAVFVCIADGRECSIPFGGILGLGAGTDEGRAARKALIECLRNLEAFLDHPSQSINLEKFRAIEKPTGFDRQALLRDQDYFSELIESVQSDDILPTSVSDADYSALAIREPTLASCPLHFFRFGAAGNESLQLDFVG